MPSRRLPALLTALTITLGLGLSGCGGDDTTVKPKPVKTSITGPGSNQTENIGTGTAFIRSLAANTPASLRTAASLVAPKSAAARYVATKVAALDGTAVPLVLTVGGEGRYRLCATTAGSCDVIAQIVLLSGKVVTFKVDGKQLR
jgi:hypothetical protein